MPKFIKVFFTFIGLGMLLFAVTFYSKTANFLKKAVHVKGVVVDLIPRGGSSRGSTYAPQVKFKTKEGKEITFVSSFSSNPPAYDVGEEVEVVYDPTYPVDAKIYGFWSLWFPVIIMVIIGIVFSLVGFLRFKQVSKGSCCNSGMMYDGDDDDWDDD